jgi:2-oxo-hept-3-ene-1,7-dioate hydratase
MADWQNVVTDDQTAYHIQDEVLRLKALPVAGYKISLTSPQTQALFNATSPLYGQQVESHFLNNDAQLSLASLNEPLIEVELAFTAKTRLLPEMSARELLANTYVSGANEIPDARFTQWFPHLSKYLVIADGAVGGYIQTGEKVDGATLTVADLANISVTLTLDGQSIASGQASEVLDNPINALQWLVHQLAEHDRYVEAGQTVSSGTFFVPPKLKTGHYVAEFSGPYQGKTTLTVTE